MAPVKRDGLTDNARLAPKPALPQRVAQNDDGRGAGTIFVIVEDPPDSGLHTQRREEVRGHMQTSQSLRLATARQVKAAPAIYTDMFKDFLLRTPVGEVGIGNQHYPEIWPVLAHPNQSLGYRVRQRAQQHGIHYTEDRRVRADAERQRGDGNQGEAGLLHQHSRAVAQVLPQGLHNFSSLCSYRSRAFPALRRFTLSRRHFQFSPQSVQLIVKLGQPCLLDLQLRVKLGLDFLQSRFLFRQRRQPGLENVLLFPQILTPFSVPLLTQEALDFFQLMLKLGLRYLPIGYPVAGITQPLGQAVHALSL